MLLVISVIVLASIIASFSDWVCMDILIHRFYAQNPQTWRANEGAGRIVISQIIGTVASAAAVLIYMRAPGQPVVVAGALWCVGALPVIAQNVQWIRMSPAVAAGTRRGGWRG